MSKIRTHYDNLKVTRNAPDVVIKAAHKALLQMHHPDKATDKVAAERITRIINEAREVLLDPVRRKQHDDWIKEKEHHRGHHSEFRHGHANNGDKQSREPEKDQLIGKYVVSAKGLATDTDAGLIWCRFALGQTWQDGALGGSAKTYTWQEAIDAANQFNLQGGYATYTDWRLPSIDELKTLINKNAGNKASGLHFIDNQVFPENPLWVWSSTPYAGYGGGAWFVYFRDGDAFNEGTNFARAVRLVRNNDA